MIYKYKAKSEEKIKSSIFSKTNIITNENNKKVSLSKNRIKEFYKHNKHDSIISPENRTNPNTTRDRSNVINKSKLFSLIYFFILLIYLN